MQNTSKPIPLSQESLNEIKISRQHAEDFFRKHRVKGWPRVVTPEHGKHFLVNH